MNFHDFFSHFLEENEIDYENPSKYDELNDIVWQEGFIVFFFDFLNSQENLKTDINLAYLILTTFPLFLKSTDVSLTRDDYETIVQYFIEMINIY